MSYAIEIAWDANGATPPDGNWSVAANWVGDVRPNTLTDAVFALPETYQVTVDAPSAAKDLLFNAGDVTLSLGTQTLQGSGSLRLGSGSLTTTHLIRQGTASAGQIGFAGFEISGGTLNVTNMNASGVGKFDFTGGTIAVRSGLFTPKLATVTFQVSQGSTGPTSIGSAFAVSGLPGGNQAEFILTAGADYATQGSAFVIGRGGGKGTALVEGQGSWLQTNQSSSADGYLYLGLHAQTTNGVHVSSEGDLTVRNRGEVSSRYATIGREGGIGNLHVTGVGSKLTIQSSLRVGESYYVRGNMAFRLGTGTVRIDAGATATGSIVVGITGGEGRMYLDGPGTSLTGLQFTVGTGRVGSSGYFVDAPGDGIWSITNGASASYSLGSAVGYNGGHGQVIVSAASLSSAGKVLVGFGSVHSSGDTFGSFSVVEGGTLTTASFATDYMPIGSNDAVGRIAVRSATEATSQWIHTGHVAVGSDSPDGNNNRGTGTLEIGSGGRVAISGSLSVAPAAGTQAGQLGGTLVMDGGELEVPTLVNQGHLSGFGRITGNVTHSGTISPGPGIGTLEIDGDLTHTDSAELVFDLDGGSSGQSDRIEVTGAVTLAGSVTLRASAGRAPSPGTSYEVLSFASANGDIQTVNATGFPGLLLTSRLTPSALLVEVSATPGDINLDAHVNFDDLLLLVQHYGLPTTQGWLFGDLNSDAIVSFDDLLLVAQNYESTSSLAGSHFAADWMLAQSLVPEPTIALAIAALGFASRRRRD